MRLLIWFFIILFFSCSVIKEDLREQDRWNKYAVGYYLGWKDHLSTQGCAIKDGILYQFRHSGVVDCSQIKENSLEYLNTITLGSYGDNNHCNSIHFCSTSNIGENLAYISSFSASERACYVERITLDNSTLIQKIIVGELELVPQGMVFNLQIGDDNFLWLVGCNNTTLRIIKFKKPNVSQKYAILTEGDVVDYWEVENYDYKQETYQGMKIYGGCLYLVYGGSYNRRGIWVYNTNSHDLIHNEDLTSKYKMEFEDIDFYKNAGYLFVLEDCILKSDRFPILPMYSK